MKRGHCDADDVPSHQLLTQLPSELWYAVVCSIASLRDLLALHSVNRDLNRLWWEEEAGYTEGLLRWTLEYNRRLYEQTSQASCCENALLIQTLQKIRVGLFHLVARLPHFNQILECDGWLQTVQSPTSPVTVGDVLGIAAGGIVAGVENQMFETSVPQLTPRGYMIFTTIAVLLQLRTGWFLLVDGDDGYFGIDGIGRYDIVAEFRVYFGLREDAT